MDSGERVPTNRPRVRVWRVAFVVLLVLVFLLTVWWRGVVNGVHAKANMSQHYSLVLGYLREFEPDSELEQRELEQKVRDDAHEFRESLGRALWKSNTKHDMVLLGIVALLLVERITAVRRLRVSGSGREPGA